MIVSSESKTSWIPIMLGSLCLGHSSLYLKHRRHSYSFSKAPSHWSPFLDDIQTYVHEPPSFQLLLANKIDLLNRLTPLKPNSFGLAHPQQLLKLDYALLSDIYPRFTFLSCVRDLGPTLDSRPTLILLSTFGWGASELIIKSVILISIVHAFLFSDWLLELPFSRSSPNSAGPLQSVLNTDARLIRFLAILLHVYLPMLRNNSTGFRSLLA